MMKLKFIAAAAVFAFSALPALAIDEIVDVAPTASFSSSVAAGAFSMNWVFNLLADSYVGASATNVAISFNGGPSFGGITDFAANLNGSPLFLNSFASGSPVNVATQVLAGSSTIPAGNFSLQVSGVAGAGGASFGGSIIATPVPEPETYAMMLAGLVAVGFLARRRG